MASRNHHSGDFRPGPHRGERLPGSHPDGAARRIQHHRFPDFRGYGSTKRTERGLPGGPRFTTRQYDKDYQERKWESERMKMEREEGLEEYLQNVEEEKEKREEERREQQVVKEEKEEDEEPKQEDVETYHRLLDMPLFGATDELISEMDISVKEDGNELAFVPKEVKEELMEEEDVVGSIPHVEEKESVEEFDLLLSIEEKEHDLLGSTDEKESVKESDLLGSIDEESVKENDLLGSIEDKENEPPSERSVMKEEDVKREEHEGKKEEMTTHLQAPESSPGHQQHEKPHSKDRPLDPANPAKLRSYKTMYDPSCSNHLNTKDFVRRQNGKCPDKYKQFDYPQAPIDPRIKFRPVQQPKNLIVPNFVVDDQYIGIPPKREVTISNLNDNVNKEFLLKMTRTQKFEPQEVQVFYHPASKKHLQMALILFAKSKEAKAFVEANDGVSVMGLNISCTLDPFAAELSASYTKLTNASLPALEYLSGMSEHELSLRREKIIGSNAGADPPVEAAVPLPVTPITLEEERERSLSPMDTSNSPMLYESLPPQPPIEPPLQQYQAHYDDAGASTSKMPSPPPPYSELPPINHAIHEERRRSTSRKRSVEPEGRNRSKRRHASTSSSSSYSSAAEGGSKGSRRRSDGGLKKKKKREEVLTVKRYVSSERNSNGEKRIVKEVETVTYKRRTETHKSPDSFDEEMKRRERSKSRTTRSSEKRGRDEMGGWSSPSSDSDSARGGRRKRGKDRTDGHTKEEDRRPQPPNDPLPSSTPLSFCSTPSTSATPSRRSGFSTVFDPTQPPPAMVPPIGVVLPALPCTSLPPPPPPPIPMPMMILPPPPLPGGFIPPPEFFGLQSTPAMLCAASAAAAGMTPLPPGPPPSPMSSIGSIYGATPGYCPTPLYASPARPVKMPLKSQQLEDSASAASCSISASVSSPSLTSSGMARPSSSSSLATTGGRTPMEMKATATPPSEGSSTSSAAKTEKEKKGNLDERLSKIFGLKMAKKEEETREMKHIASAPSISTMGGEQRKMEDDDMDIDDDDDMDVVSSSPEETRGAEKTTMEMERRTVTEEETRREADAERRKKEEQAAHLTKITLDKLVQELTQQMARDIRNQLEKTAFAMADEWEKRQRSEVEERKRQMIRDNLIASVAANENRGDKTTEQMLVAKFASPECLASGGISKMFSSIPKIMKKVPIPTYSRDGTPASDSRAQSIAKSRSPSRSPTRSGSSSSNEAERRSRRKGREESSVSSDSEDEEEKEEEDIVRKAVRRRPNVRNIESSQESSMASSSDSDSDEEEELDVDGMSEDEAEQTKKKIKHGEEGSSSPDVVQPSSSAAAAAFVASSSDQVLKTEEEEGAHQMPSTSREPVVVPPPLTPAELAAARQVAQADLLLQQPSMRPDERGYDPVRYDHPYVRQLGLPFVENRTILPTALHRVTANNMGGRVPACPSPLLGAAAGPSAGPSTSQQPQLKPIKSKKDAQMRIDGADRVSHELLGLLPPAVSRRTIKVEEERKRPKKSFRKRSPEEEKTIKDGFKAGVDGEDNKYLEEALKEMQKDGARPFGVDREIEFDSFLRSHTPRELPRPKRLGRVDLYYDDEELAGIVPHSTGCARSEGFYRLTQKQKIRILRRPEAFQDRTEINERDEVVTRHTLHAQKEQRSMNRRLLTMADTNPNSDFFKVNQLKYRKKMIKFARSRIHGWGLYALEPIAPDDMIVEYIGQKIRPIVAEEREKQYERRGIGSSYLFRIDEDEVIDATRQGNFARFINHSCQPNCYAKVVTVDGDKRIVIYSKNLIQKGDEITYDYKFPVEEDKIECLCGAPACRGTLN